MLRYVYQQILLNRLATTIQSRINHYLLIGGQRVELPLLCVIAFYLAVFAHYVINGDRYYICPIVKS